MVRVRRSGAIAALTAIVLSSAAQASELNDAKHLGVATCASSLCHGSARPLTARPVLQNEYVTWSHFDPHARAYRVLLEERGLQIARRLGLRNAHEAQECLACHADTTPVPNRGERFQVSDGIGCETCHGGAEHWLASHDDAPAHSHSDNVKRGMRALERPEVRAQVCVGCHVGDSGRFASHSMMAAGHPRLAFELDTYTELWRTSGGREHFRRDTDYLARKGAFEPVHAWLAGLAEATRRQAALVDQRLALANGGFPDFALFNCYSCHSAMRVEAWGDAEQSTAPRGSLRLHDGHARALLAVLEATDAPLAASLRSAMAALQAANGNPIAVASANQSLRETLALIERRVAERAWKPQDLSASLDALIDAARRGAFVDYAAAEQAAMGMVLLLAELGADGRRTAEVDAMFRTLQNDAQFDRARFARALELLAPAR